MKRLVIIAIALLAFCACEDEKADNSPWTFEQLLARDYKIMKDSAPDGFFFYEVQCEMTGSPAVLPADSIRVENTITIAEAEGNTVYFIYSNLSSHDTNIQTVENDWWMGDFDMGDPTKVAITFDEAVRMLKNQTGYEIPDSNIMTFAQPTSGLILHPRYIFGSLKTGFVYIDAVTGEIGTMSPKGDWLGSGEKSENPLTQKPF